MINLKHIGVLVSGVLIAATMGATSAADAPEAGKVIVSLYRAAPGKQLDLLKWLAARDAVSQDAGLAPAQIYAHTDGDSWDYVMIAPQTTAEQDAKIEELEKKKGLKTGFAAGLEIRQYVAEHSDTFARGPVTAADLVKRAGGK
jgi:hypothetical protein